MAKASLFLFCVLVVFVFTFVMSTLSPRAGVYS